MGRGLEQKAATDIPEMIARWLDEEPGNVFRDRKVMGNKIDLLLRAGDYTFLVEWKGSGTAAVVSNAIKALRAYAQLLAEPVIPVVAVPFMGEVGRAICANEGVSWLDLSGNAQIVAPGLRIHVEGKSNQFKNPGRPKNVFAPKSARITRRLLIEPERWVSQRELALEARVDEALVSRVVRQLERDDLVTRNGLGAVRPTDPNLLLDAWAEAYDFSKHLILEGFVALRTSDAVVQELSDVFEGHSIRYAATGLAAAWLLTQFAQFRISTFYLSEKPSKNLLKQWGFQEQTKGGNVWLVIPNDEGVFDGASEREGVQCTHPAQVYLDLKGHPERAKEAAEMLRHQYLAWGTHAR